MLVPDEISARRPAAATMHAPEAPPFRPEILARNGDIVVHVYGEIGWDFDAATFAERIRSSKGGKIRVHVNSYGGDAWSGVAVYNILRQEAARRPVAAYVDGEAASAASIIVMAADERNIPASGMMMIHHVWTRTVGNAAELRKVADSAEALSEQFAQVYAARSGVDVDTVRQWMDDEREMFGADAVECGFCTDVLDVEAQASTAPAEWLRARAARQARQRRRRYQRWVEQTAPGAGACAGAR